MLTTQHIGAQLAALVFLALAVSAISMTVTKARVFKEMRLWVAKRSYWLGELVDCPYCFSHWVALILVVVYQPEIINSGVDYLDWFVAIMAIVALAALFSGLIYRSIAQMEH